MKGASVIKKIIFSTIIIIFLIGLIFAIMTIFKDDEKTKMLKSISTTTPKQIEIIKTGNPVLKKVITSDEDMKKIISFIKSIKLGKKVDTNVKGWGYSVRIFDDNGNEYSVAFLRDLISFNNSFYSMNETVGNEFDDLYSQLDYSEKGPFE